MGSRCLWTSRVSVRGFKVSNDVSKTWRNSSYKGVSISRLQRLTMGPKTFFQKIESTKPAASRSASAEIYIYCSHYLAPKKIDPKLLDPKHVFAQVEETKAAPSVFDKSKRKRHREGYSGSITQFQELGVAAFIEGHEPQLKLATYNALKFDEKSEKYLSHPDTTEELKALCKDLKVLGKGDFGHLLKWRRKMIKFRQETAKKEKAEAKNKKEQEEAEQEDVKIKDVDAEDAQITAKLLQWQEKLKKTTRNESAEEKTTSTETKKAIGNVWDGERR